MLSNDEMLFFDALPAALPIYERFAARAAAELPAYQVRVQKTQITYSNRYVFACASFLKVRKAKERPNPYLVITVGLNRRLESPRVDAAVEPYPGRWTHHITVASPEEIDDELMAWVQEAYAFAAIK